VEAIGMDSPYSAYGRYYKRCDDQDLEMTQNELEYFFNNKNISYTKWEKTITQFGADDVDEDLLIKYIDKANEFNRLNYRYKSVEDAMTRLGLMENGKLNNAGYYLFSKSKPLLVKFARYATDERITFIDNRHYQGNIFECIEEAYNYILASINFNAIIVGIERVEKPEIPLEAIREIVVNSFAHMRVNDGDYNEITISPHYLRIYNPGTIALNKDPKEFAKGIIGSKLRNPLIALTLYKNKTIEAFGTGFKRVFDLCNLNDVKYSYTNEGLGFAFTFERNITSLLHQNDRTNDRIKEKLMGSELQIYEHILEKKIINNAKDTAKELNKSIITIQRGIKKLVELGLIERIGSNKTGYWKIK
jgi:predicted HTH transcriptional regulator